MQIDGDCLEARTLSTLVTSDSFELNEELWMVVSDAPAGTGVLTVVLRTGVLTERLGTVKVSTVNQHEVMRL